MVSEFKKLSLSYSRNGTIYFAGSLADRTSTVTLTFDFNIFASTALPLRTNERSSGHRTEVACRRCVCRCATHSWPCTRRIMHCVCDAVPWAVFTFNKIKLCHVIVLLRYSNVIFPVPLAVECHSVTALRLMDGPLFRVLSGMLLFEFENILMEDSFN